MNNDQISILNNENDEEKESVVIEITESFLNDLEKLNKPEQKKVKEKLELVPLIIESQDAKAFLHLFKKVKSLKLHNYNSSLYSLRVGKDIKIFLFSENDPIFRSTNITFLRIFKDKDTNKVLRSIAESFYQKELAELGDTSDAD